MVHFIFNLYETKNDKIVPRAYEYHNPTLDIIYTFW